MAVGHEELVKSRADEVRERHLVLQAQGQGDGIGADQFFVPNGHTDDPEIPRVRSAVDYIARRLAIDWLPYPERTALGVYTLTERVHRASTWIEAHQPSLRLT